MFTFHRLSGQQLPYYAVFRENWVLLNPAFLDHFYLEDNDRTAILNCSHREQWIGFEGAPRQSSVRLENILVNKRKARLNVPRMKWGLGAENEKIGDFSRSGVLANYAYIFNLSDLTTISTGFSTTFSNNVVSLNPVTFKDWQNDVAAQSLENINSWFGKMDVGIFIKHKPKDRFSKIDNYYVGISAMQLASMDFPFESNILDRFKKPHFNFLAGLFIGEQAKGGSYSTYLEPSVWIRYLPGTTFKLFDIVMPVSTDFSLRLFVNEKIWIGSGFGTSGNLSIDTGYSFQKGRKKRNMHEPRIRMGALCNIPVLGSPIGYSVEAFIGLGLASY